MIEWPRSKFLPDWEEAAPSNDDNFGSYLVTQTRFNMSENIVSEKFMYPDIVWELMLAASQHEASMVYFWHKDEKTKKIYLARTYLNWCCDNGLFPEGRIANQFRAIGRLYDLSVTSNSLKIAEIMLQHHELGLI